MKMSSAGILILWVGLLGKAILTGYWMPAKGQLESLAQDKWTTGVILIAPLASILLGFRKKYVPGSLSSIAPFLIRLRLELLIASSCFAFGLVGLVRSFQLNAGKEVFIVIALSFSGALGLGGAYIVLRRRGMV